MLLLPTPNSSLSLSIRFSNAWHKPPPTPSSTQLNLDNPMDFDYLSLEDPLYLPEAQPDREYNDKSTRLIRMTRPFRIRWDLLTMILALYNCITVPLVIAFDLKQPTGLVAINCLADIAFITDIVLNFFTTYINSNGEEVIEQKLISLQYLKFMFWIDLVSSIPSDLLGVIFSTSLVIPDALNFTDMMKTVRVIRLNRMIRFMRSKNEHKALFRLLIMLLYLGLWVHFAGCIWFGLGRMNGEWMPVNSWPYMNLDIFSADLYTQYGYSLYHGVWCLRGNELGPLDYKMAAVGGILMIFGSMFTAILFGEVAVLMREITRKSTNFQNTIENCLTAARELQLSDELTNKILDYVTSSKAQLSLQSEFDEFTKQISPSLQSLVRECLYGNLLQKNIVLASNPQAAQAIVMRLNQRLYKPEEVIVEEGTVSDSMFFVVRGEVCVWVVDEFKDRRPICFLGDGAHFGEVGLVYKTLRTATIISRDFSTVAQLIEADFNDVVSQFPKLIDNLRKSTDTYDDPWKQYLTKGFVQASCFSYLPRNAMQEFAYLCDVDWIKPGEYLFRPGDKVDRAYLITEGKLELSFTFNEKSLHLLKKSSSFLSKIERAPTVERRRLTELDYSLWNVDLSQLTMLKPCYEALPFVNESGVVSSKLYGEQNPPNSKSIGDYPQEVTLEFLHKGTLLNTDLMLIDSRHELSCKAVTLSKVYSFNTEIIHELAVRHPRFDHSIANRKEKLGVVWKEVLNPIDIKYQQHVKNFRRLWKSAIVRVILIGRRNRMQGAWKIVSLVTKIRAVLACENAGKYELAQKVIQDLIPPHYITEEGNLDPSVSVESTSVQNVTSTHPVMQIIKRFHRDITEPRGPIHIDLSSLDRIAVNQGRQLTEMRKDLLETKLSVLELLQSFDHESASLFHPQFSRFASESVELDDLRKSFKTRAYSMFGN